MSSIKDFAKKPIDNQDLRDKIPEDVLKKTEEDYSDLIDLFMSKYGTMSEDELIQEMLKLINEKKKNGTFDARKIRDLASKVAPFLTDEQIAKMYQLLNYLD